MRRVVWHDCQVDGPLALWRLLTRPGSEQQAGDLARDTAQVLRVTLLMAAVAFPCCFAALTLTFLYAVTLDHVLLTASAWLIRVAQGSCVVVWAATLRFWWRDRRRTRRWRD